VSLPGSADTVCPTVFWWHVQVQHSAKTAQTYHVTLRPWPSILEVTAPVV